MTVNRNDKTDAASRRDAGQGVLRSMTGFAAARGAGTDGTGWAWDLRAVNNRGFDLRLRLPDGIDGLEPALRKLIADRVRRGSVTLSLRLERPAAEARLRPDPQALAQALAALRQVQTAAEDTELTLRPTGAAEILALRGVMDNGQAETADTAGLRDALLAELPALVDAFDAMRLTEGAALGAVITGQLDRIAALTDAAAAELAPREARMAEALRAGLARLGPLLAETGTAARPDPGRLEQELAMLLVKADVTEEIDRLRAHVAAARDMLAEGGAVGRKLDFLTQEFNREANTLCSKAQSSALTRIGLDLKAVIDQMREQVQNLE